MSIRPFGVTAASFFRAGLSVNIVLDKCSNKVALKQINVTNNVKSVMLWQETNPFQISNMLWLYSLS